ncbi:MAG: hypothetical protein WC711_01275 [Candidatus Staskawiczbacteria bacterium]
MRTLLAVVFLGICIYLGELMGLENWTVQSYDVYILTALVATIVLYFFVLKPLPNNGSKDS